MKTRNYNVSVLVAMLLGCVMGHSLAHRQAQSSGLSEMENLEKVARYNSYISRMRRSTQPAQGLQSTGVKFRVASCSLEAFLHKAKNCSRGFYSSVRRKDASHHHCGQKYQILRSCMLNTLTNCLDGSYVGGPRLSAGDKQEMQHNFLVFLGNEEFWCVKGGVGISSDYLPVGAICNPVFHQVSEGCTATYNRLFNSSAPEERLCGEYQKAQKCYLQTIFKYCDFSRMLLQMLEIIVEITADFQPFCPENAQQEMIKFEDLVLQRTCPPHSLADVAFAFDVTNSTTRQQFIAMKRVVQEVTRRMNYGWEGIHIAVYQFDLQLRNLIKFGRATTKDGIRRHVRRMRRTTTTSKNKKRRLTGRALSTLARGTFSPAKEGVGLQKNPLKSGQRPHNTAVAFVFTTGPSSDSMTRALETLRDRKVQVVFVGPSSLQIPAPSNQHLGGAEYPVITTDFELNQVKNIASQVAEEICNADKQREWGDRSRLAEGQQKNSKWGGLQTLLQRGETYDMSLLFELMPIVPTGQTSLPVTTSMIPGGWDGLLRNPMIFEEQSPTIFEGNDFEMDGDNTPQTNTGNDKPVARTDYMGPHFIYLENEYIQEYQYP